MFAWALALVLLFSNSLSVLHGIAHQHGQPAAVVDRTNALEPLFASHHDADDDDDSLCLLFDQTSQCDTPPLLATPAIGLNLPPARIAQNRAYVSSRRHALFQARGPPPFR